MGVLPQMRSIPRTSRNLLGIHRWCMGRAFWRPRTFLSALQRHEINDYWDSVVSKLNAIVLIFGWIVISVFLILIFHLTAFAAPPKELNSSWHWLDFSSQDDEYFVCLTKNNVNMHCFKVHPRESRECLQIKGFLHCQDFSDELHTY